MWPWESRVMVEEATWEVFYDWPLGERVTKEFLSFVVVDCPAPVTRIPIGTWGFVHASFSAAGRIWGKFCPDCFEEKFLTIPDKFFCKWGMADQPSEKEGFARRPCVYATSEGNPHKK
jgi:hypothetical protein